jgi:hypothetical protein
MSCDDLMAARQSQPLGGSNNTVSHAMKEDNNNNSSTAAYNCDHSNATPCDENPSGMQWR